MKSLVEILRPLYVAGTCPRGLLTRVWAYFYGYVPSKSWHRGSGIVEEEIDEKGRGLHESGICGRRDSSCFDARGWWGSCLMRGGVGLSCGELVKGRGEGVLWSGVDGGRWVGKEEKEL